MPSRRPSWPCRSRRPRWRRCSRALRRRRLLLGRGAEREDGEERDGGELKGGLANHQLQVAHSPTLSHTPDRTYDVKSSHSLRLGGLRGVVAALEKLADLRVETTAISVRNMSRPTAWTFASTFASALRRDAALEAEEEEAAAVERGGNGSRLKPPRYALRRPSMRRYVCGPSFAAAPTSFTMPTGPASSGFSFSVIIRRDPSRARRRPWAVPSPRGSQPDRR